MSESLENQLQWAWKHQIAREFPQADLIYRQLLAANPNHAELMHQYGLFLQQTNRAKDGIAMIERAVALAPAVAKYRANLAAYYFSAGQLQLAIEQAKEALKLEPDQPVSHYNLGAMLREAADFEGAIAQFRRAISLQSNFPQAYESLAAALAQVGLPGESIESLRTVLALDPTNARAGSNLLMTMNYLPGVSSRAIRAAHVDWARRHYRPPRSPAEFRNDHSPDRMLRIGYLSPDFRHHAMASFLENILIAHDRARVRVYAYSASPTFDEVSARLKTEADEWRDIARLDDDTAERMIIDDAIDILVEAAGHTAGNRLLLMLRQPAPVQFTYLGYPATTGVPAIQYLLTDAIVDPPGDSDSHFTEVPVRLPDCLLCYRADDSAPAPPSQSPASANGFVTFGSFNNFVKVTDEMINLWANILAAVEGSRLLIKSPGVLAASASQRIKQMFAQSGVSSDRVMLIGRTDQRAQLSAIASVDIALDTFPYGGTTTTCETLWMAVPIITRAGEMHASRVSASVLSAIGCPELIARDADDYVAKAIQLANDLSRLNGYRASLRERMRRSPVLDRDRFVRNLEAIYRKAWRDWLAVTTP